MAKIVGIKPVDLRELGCSAFHEYVTYREVFSYKGPDRSAIAAATVKPFAIGLAVTIVISLALYALVRAIGWVIGGFVTS